MTSQKRHNLNLYRYEPVCFCIFVYFHSSASCLFQIWENTSCQSTKSSSIWITGRRSDAILKITPCQSTKSSSIWITGRQSEAILSCISKDVLQKQIRYFRLRSIRSHRFHKTVLHGSLEEFPGNAIQIIPVTGSSPTDTKTIANVINHFFFVYVHIFINEMISFFVAMATYFM